MDPMRHQAMMNADPDLSTSVTGLSGQTVDPNYAPPGLDKEMMYRPDVIYQAPDYQDPRYADEPQSTGAGMFWFWFWLFSGSAFLIWFVFIKRWPVSRPAGPYPLHHQ